MLMLKSFGLVLGLLYLTSGAHAQNLATADTLFARRAEGSATIAQARTAYKSLLGRTSGRDYVHTIQQLSLLAFYEAQYVIPENNYAARAAVFADCRKTAAGLAGQKAFVSQYIANYMGCTAQWMRYASISDRLGELRDVRAVFNEFIGDNLELKPEKAVDTRYYGGVIFRVLSGIYASNLSQLVRSSLPDKAKAIDMANRSTRSARFPGEFTSGSQHYGNYRYKAEALIANNQISEAKALLIDKIAEIEELKADGDLPRGLEPESLGELAIMRRILANL